MSNPGKLGVKLAANSGRVVSWNQRGLLCIGRRAMTLRRSMPTWEARQEIFLKVFKG